jgi:preprotein translocase subunit SecE
MGKAMAWPGRVKKYVEELRDEMKLVTWPSWKQVRATTAVVIAAVFAFALYFAVVDQAVGWAIEQVFTRFAS